MPEKKDDELQQKSLQYQVLESSLRTARGQIEQAVARAEELAQTKNALEELEGVKAGDSAFIPVGSGSFVDGKVGDSSTVLVSIGGEVAVRKTRKEAIAFLEDRLEEMRKALEELSSQERAAVSELRRLQPEIQKLLSNRS